MDCKLRAKNCGGCPLLGLDYAEQLKQKEATVKKLLGKYGPVNAIRGMEKGDLHLYHRLGWKTDLRHLRGKQPQGAAGGKLPFAGRSAG